MAGGGATTPASLLCAVPRGRERCAGATAPSAAAETWWRQGTAPGRWGDGGAKGQRRREQARLAPRGEWARGFGAGAGDLTQEVGELPRASGDLAREVGGERANQEIASQRRSEKKARGRGEIATMIARGG